MSAAEPSAHRLRPGRSWLDRRAVEHHWDGASAHPSFADWLQWFVDRPDRRPKPQDPDALVVAHRAGAKWTLFDLAELGDSRVFDLAREKIAGNPDERLASLLGRMGDPAGSRCSARCTRRPAATFASRR